MALPTLYKSIIANTFVLSMYQCDSVNFIVNVRDSEGIVEYATKFCDYRTASIIFDTKLRELEGH